MECEIEMLSFLRSDQYAITVVSNIEVIRNNHFFLLFLIIF